MMTIKEMMARPRGATAMAAMRALVLAVAFATVGIPVVSWAQQVPDAAAGANRPKMDSAANGVPVVDIVAPNARGVSHNKYQRFDVDQRGVILNNSASIVKTQLGGYIAGNDNLKGGEASLILNEVTSALPSSLRGYIEVGGKAAPVVIANPYGITCDGCGVINSQRFTLTTGTPVFGGSGSLDAFHVAGGSIAIGSGGLDGSVVDRTDLIARAVQVNGQIWAKELNVVAGANDANYADAGVRANAADAARPGVAIDVAALGGMYAEKIRLVGTEAGVGVVSSGAIAAQAGDLELTSAGEVRLGGTTVALNNATLRAAGPVTIDGTFGTQAGNVYLAALGPFAVRGRVIAAGSLALDAASGVDNAGIAVSGGRFDIRTGGFTNRAGGVVSSGGELVLSATGDLINDGILVGGNGLGVTARGIASRGELGTQQGNASLASSADMTLAGTTVAAGTLSLRTPGTVTQQGQLTAGGVDANVGALGNQGDFYARGDGQVQVAGDVSNNGSLYADGRLALSANGAVSNTGTLHAGTDLALKAGTLDNRKQIDAARDVSLSAQSIQLAGNVQGGRDVALVTGGTLDNAATVVAGRDMAVTAGSVANAGALSANHNLTLSVAGDLAGAGQLYAGQALTADAGTLAVGTGGSVSAGDAVTLRVRDGMQNAGNVVGTNTLRITAASIDSTGSLGSTQGAATLTTTGGDIHLGGLASAAGSFQVRSARDLLIDGKLTGATLDVASASAMTLAGSFYAASNAVFDAGQAMALGGDAYADGALTLHAATTLAQSGTTHAGGDLSLQAASITTQGTLDATRDLALHADSLSFAGRAQAGHDLTLNAAQDIANAGLLYAGNVLNLDASSFAQAATGQLNGGQGLSLTVAGAVDSDGAIIGGNGLTVRAGSLRSGGQLGTAGGDLSLTTTQSALSLAGTTVSAGRIDATSAGDLTQAGSLSAAAAALGSSGDLTLGGDTSVDGALSLEAGRDLRNTGSVYAAGTLDAHASRDIDNRGSIGAEQALTARAEGTLTQDASGKLQSNAALTVAAGRIDSAGLLASAHDVSLTSQGDTVLSGTTQAGGTLGVDTVGALTNAGKLLASSDLTLHAATIGNTGDISTDGALGLHAADTLDNQGNIYTGKALTLGGATFAQGAAATLSSGDDLTIDVSGALTNAGKLIAAKTLDLKGGSLSNTGTLGTQQGNVHLLTRQGDLVLGGTVVSASDLDATAAGALRQSGQLNATGLTLRAEGDLTTQGDVAAKTASLSSAATLSQGGTLSADTITLDGKAISNAGRTLSSGNLTARGETIDVAGTLAAGVKDDGTLDTAGDLHVLADTALTAHGSLLAGRTLDVQGNALDLSYGTQRAGGDAGLIARAGNIDHTGGDLAIGGALTAQASGTLVNRGLDGHDARLQANALLLSAAAIDNSRGKLLQTGTSALAIRTAGTIDNTGGTIASNGSDLTLHGGRVVNASGNVQLAGTGLLDVGADQDVDNRQGTIISNGATRVVATTALANDGGLINAQGATTITAASLGNTANGAISGKTLSLTVTNGVNNAGGLLQATGGNIGISAASLTNSGGTIQSVPGAATLGVSGVLDNGSGVIAAGGLTTLNAARLINAGTISGGQLSVQATDTVANTGALQSLGALDLRATNGLNNNGGRIEANGATTLNSASISNVGGRIANASAALTQVTSGGGIDNRGGTLGGQGDVSLSGTSISNAQGGTLVAANNLTLGTGLLDNTSGTVYAGNTFNFVNGSATAVNAGGKITAGHQLNLTLATLNNAGGTVQAGIDGVGGVGNVSLDVRNITGQGSIIANNTLGMHLVGDYIQAAGSSIKANGGFNLAVDGQFTNNGSIQAVNGLTISAANITNNAGALLNSANTQLNTGGTITNAGDIEGNTVGLHAGVVNNTGSIMGGNVTIQAGTVINGADFGQGTGNAAYQSGTIAATNSVDIYTNYLLNRDAQIFSLGSINVAGAGRNGQGLFDTRAGQIDNISGSIQAQGNILLAANQINNVRRVLNTTSHTLTADESAASQPLPRSDYKYAINKVQEYETWTEYHTIDETVVNAASAQSQIVAGGSISLYGSVTNNTSTIAAGGFLAVNQQGAGGGTGMIAGNENVANQSLAAGRTIQTVAVTHHIGCGTDQSLCNNAGGDEESYSRRPNTDPSTYIHDNYTALGAVMSGAQGVSIGGVNVSNGGVTADGRSVGNSRLDPNAQAIGLASVNKGNAQGAGGLPVGAQVDPATGHAPQVLGGAGQPLAGVTLPTGGIYSVRGGDSVAVDGPTAGGQIVAASAGERSTVGTVDAGALSASATGASARYVGLMGNAFLAALLGHAPSRNYLIETNSRFTDFSQFISSDYLLDKLGIDPARTMMRLGDGFYEQQLVTNQVTQLTGRAYLSDYSSGLEEYPSLMNNATHVAQAMNLSVGVALTADQVSALTQDMVWMVQQTVDGHEVLVPVVYLASGNLGLTTQGAVIAGSDVSINATGTLSNDGTIRGENSTLLTAKDLLNSGRISSDGLTAISTSGNITNLNGRIDGAGVSLVAGGDIRSENVGGLVGRGMDGASITATQGLQISAGNNLSLDHTVVNAGGDALLSAGHDLTLAGQGVSAGGSLALAAGNNLSLESSLTTTHPYAWSSTLTGTQASGITLSAGKDLSLVAGNDLSLSASTLKAGGNAALQAGNDLTVGAVQSGTRWKTETTGSSIDAGGSLVLQAGHDLGVQAGTLKAGGDVALLAGNDLALTATTNGSATKVTHDVTSVDAGGNLAIVAGHDATLEGTQLKAGGAAALQAGNDLNLTTVTDSQTTTASWKEGKKHITQTTTDETVRGVTLDAGTGVQIVAGHDATLDAATIGTKTGDLTLAAGHDLTLTTEDENHTVVTDTKKKKSGLLSSKTTTTHDEVSSTYGIGTSLSGDNVHLIAGNDLTATAATVKADGGIALSAGHDVNLLAGEDVYDESHSRTVKRSGMTRGTLPADWNYQTQAKANADTSEDRVAVGTTLSGDSVTVSANHDINTQAAQIAGTHDVTLAAGHDLNIGTALSTHAEGHEQKVSTSGFIQDGLHVTIGNQKTKGTLDVTQIDSTGSLIGSTDGRVTLAAGQDVHITGSDVLSHTGTSIVGQNVTIDAGLGTVDSRQTQSAHSGGINVGLTGGVVDTAQGIYASAHRAGQVDDDRLKALYAMKTTYGVMDALGVGPSAPKDGDSGNSNGISVRVGLGASTVNSHTNTHDDTTTGSAIRSDGSVTIAAMNGNLNVIGSQIDGKNVSLAATGDLNLLSQLEAHTQKSNSANASGEFGISVGSQTGIYVTASIGKGITHGNGTTNANTSVNASDTLSLVSGNDTNIRGAQAKGESVVAAIGGDLNIASQQVTNDYASQYWQVGGTYVYGYGSQVNIAAGKTTSNYKSVDEISGIGAGSGGYNIYVSGNTDLKGGVIASAADAAKNALSTGSLSFSDVENKADYHSVSGSASVGSGGSFSGSMSVPQSKDASSTTRAGIADGMLDVRNQPSIDLSGLDRNPDLDAGGLRPIFDAKKVAEREELGQVAGQVGFRVAGDIGEVFDLKEGSPEKVALHGAVAAAMASLGGGDVGQAVAGATANQLAINALSQSLQDAGYLPGTPEFASLMKLGSSAIGLAAGGSTGAVVAESATQNNWLLHSEVEWADKKRAECGSDQACKDQITAAMEKLSLERDYEREQFSNSYFANVAQKYGVLTEGDKDAAAKAYYSYYGISPGARIDAEYEPSNDLMYQFRQVVAGFDDARKAVDLKLDHYGDYPNEIPGAVVGAVYGGIKKAASNAADYLSSDVPAWTLAQQTHDQYGVPTAYNSGVMAYTTALTAALAAPAMASGGGAGALYQTPSWISEWSSSTWSGGGAATLGYYPIASAGGDVPLLLTGGTNGGQIAGALSQIATSMGTADSMAGWRLSLALAAQQSVDPLIGTTLPGALAPVKVTAEGSVGGKTFSDVNQTARPLADQSNTPTLIADLIGEDAPNGTYADAHAEIGTIQQAYDAGLTKGQDMTIVVRGQDPCGYCAKNLKAMADRAGLNVLTVVDGTTGKVMQWSRGSSDWVTIKEEQLPKAKRL
ncbi:MAG TPA: hemagglutinin repeat-containing protein [Luteibacter sp.]|jgi:filamentous hemagglutinin|uniref:two-partner secretion domain-containing protein n=1 Tax=Luteibacter sp. TaxID=1886636 RepID=UPI002F3FB5DD